MIWAAGLVMRQSSPCQVSRSIDPGRRLFGHLASYVQSMFLALRDMGYQVDKLRMESEFIVRSGQISLEPSELVLEIKEQKGKKRMF